MIKNIIRSLRVWIQDIQLPWLLYIIATYSYRVIVSLGCNGIHFPKPNDNHQTGYHTGNLGDENCENKIPKVPCFRTATLFLPMIEASRDWQRTSKEEFRIWSLLLIRRTRHLFSSKIKILRLLVFSYKLRTLISICTNSYTLIKLTWCFMCLCVFLRVTTRVIRRCIHSWIHFWYQNMFAWFQDSYWKAKHKMEYCHPLNWFFSKAIFQNKQNKQKIGYNCRQSMQNEEQQCNSCTCLSYLCMRIAMQVIQAVSCIRL